MGSTGTKSPCSCRTRVRARAHELRRQPRPLLRCHRPLCIERHVRQARRGRIPPPLGRRRRTRLSPATGSGSVPLVGVLGGVGEVLARRDVMAPLPSTCVYTRIVLVGGVNSGRRVRARRGRGGGRGGGKAGLVKVSAHPRGGHRVGVAVVECLRAVRGASACVPAWSALSTSSLVSCARSASLKSLTAGQFTGSVVRSSTGAAGPFLSARRARAIFRRSLRAVASETAP